MRRESKNYISGRRYAGRVIAILIVFFLLFLSEIAFLWSFGTYILSGKYNDGLPLISNVFSWLLSPGWAMPSAELWKYISKKLLPAAGIAAVLTLMFWLSLSVRGNFKNVEDGSSHWATLRELKIFRKKKNNMPIAHKLYQTEEAKLPNNNVAIVAGPGTGKTFCAIIPSIEAATNPEYEQDSFICTDTKGSIYRTTAKMVRERGMKVYMFNLADPEYSNCYSPLELIHKDVYETEISQLALAYTKNVRDEEAAVGDAIWEQSFKALLTAVWLYQYKYSVNPVNNREETKALWRTAELIRNIKLHEGKIGDCEIKRIVDSIRQTDPLSPIVANFDFVTAGAGETISSVIFTAGSKMECLSFSAVECLTRKNEIPLDDLAEEPTAVYVNYNVGSPYRALASIFLEQTFICLYYNAERRYNQSLPRRVRFLLDELPNICRIYSLPERLSTCREYNIDVVLIMQSLEQLKRGYDKAENTLLNNCAVQGLFGSSEPDTLKRFSEMLGKTTTIEQDSSRNRGGKEGGGSESEKLIGRELAFPAELFTLNTKYCVLLMQGYPPVFAEKFRTLKQPWYKELGGKGSKENSRSIEDDYKKLRALHIAEYEEEKQMRVERIKTDRETETMEV